jgi:translation initiation factor 5B
VQIEGLQASSGGAPTAKKVVYGNRKKKGPGGAGTSAHSSPVVVPRSLSPEPTPEPTPASTPVTKVENLPAQDDVKSDWDASTDDEAKASASAEVKDSWDASSEDEGERPAPKSASCLRERSLR